MVGKDDGFHFWNGNYSKNQAAKAVKLYQIQALAVVLLAGAACHGDESPVAGWCSEYSLTCGCSDLYHDIHIYLYKYIYI